MLVQSEEIQRARRRGDCRRRTAPPLLECVPELEQRGVRPANDPGAILDFRGLRARLADRIRHGLRLERAAHHPPVDLSPPLVNESAVAGVALVQAGDPLPAVDDWAPTLRAVE